MPPLSPYTEGDSLLAFSSSYGTFEDGVGHLESSLLATHVLTAYAQRQFQIHVKLRSIYPELCQTKVATIARPPWPLTAKTAATISRKQET